MRRFDRTYMNFSSPIEDERRVALPKDDGWIKSTIDHLATTQNKLQVNVSQNYENIMLCRQENVAVAENLRSAATMWQQFGEKVTRLADQIEFERSSVESANKDSNQKISHLSGQFRQLMNGGMQVERNVSKLEEEVLRLKQSSEQTNKKVQQLGERMNELQLQLDKQTNTVDLGIQDLRQLNHQTELNTKKMVRGMMQDMEHRLNHEEEEKKEVNVKISSKLNTLESIINELRKNKTYNNGNYAALIEEKDQEYKAELKNFLRKVKTHVEEKNLGSQPGSGKLFEEIRKKLQSVEQKLSAEEEARSDGIKRLEEETALHFKRVSGHIIQQLDILGSAITSTNANPNIGKDLAEMRKEIEENKNSINRVLRAEITARKSQAKKFHDSIEGFEKQKNQTVLVLREAIAEMKAYIDKELETKTGKKDGNDHHHHHHIIPKLDQRLADVEERLGKQINENKKRIESGNKTETDLLKLLNVRMSDLEEKVNKDLLTIEKISPTSDEIAKEILPTLDRKLSSLQKKLERQLLRQQTPTSDYEITCEKVIYLEREIMDLRKIISEKDEEIKFPIRNDHHAHEKISGIEREILELRKKVLEQEKGIENSSAPDEIAREILPSLERKLSDLEEKLEKQILDQQRRDSMTFIKSPLSPGQDHEILKRLSMLEGKLKWQMSLTMTHNRQKHQEIEKQIRVKTADCHKPQLKAKPPTVRRNSSYLKIEPTKENQKSSHLHLTRDRLNAVEQRLQNISMRIEETEDELEVLNRRTRREMVVDKKIRNKLIEFINKRCMEGKHLQLFIKSFSVQQIKYFMDYTGKKLLLNKWGIYQALRMYQFKKRWLELIGKKPFELTVKEYREIVREEREEERARLRKEEKKKPVSPIVIDSMSESETEEEPESEPIPGMTKPPEAEKDEKKDEKEEEEKGEKEEKKEEEGPKRINYEEENSGDDYIQYKTDDDDDFRESDDEFFPQTSEDDDDDYKLFSDEDEEDEDEDDEDDDDEEEDGEEGVEKEDDDEEEDADEGGDKDDETVNEEQNEDDDDQEEHEEEHNDRDNDEDNDEDNDDDDDDNDDEKDNGNNREEEEDDDGDDDDDGSEENDGGQDDDDNEDDGDGEEQEDEDKDKDGVKNRNDKNEDNGPSNKGNNKNNPKQR